MCLSHAPKSLTSQWVVSPRGLRSTESLVGGCLGGAAWIWSSPALCPSSHMVEFGEVTPTYWDVKLRDGWACGLACFASFLLDLDGTANRQNL